MKLEIENLRFLVVVVALLFPSHLYYCLRAIEFAVYMDSPIPVFWFDLARLKTNDDDDFAVFAVHRL